MSGGGGELTPVLTHDHRVDIPGRLQVIRRCPAASVPADGAPPPPLLPSGQRRRLPPLRRDTPSRRAGAETGLPWREVSVKLEHTMLEEISLWRELVDGINITSGYLCPIVPLGRQ